MSLITKIFTVLTAIAGVVFLLMAGSLIAKQEQFKVRLAGERINRVHEELIQDRLQNRYAAGAVTRSVVSFGDPGAP